MRYIVTLFWSIILGQIVGFIGSNLTGNTYSFAATSIASILVAFVVIILDQIVEPKKS